MCIRDSDYSSRLKPSESVPRQRTYSIRTGPEGVRARHLLDVMAEQQRFLRQQS